MMAIRKKKLQQGRNLNKRRKKKREKKGRQELKKSN